MSLILAVRLAVAVLVPMPSDTPPPPPVETLDKLRSVSDLASVARMMDGSPVPATFVPPATANQLELVDFLIANYPAAMRSDTASRVNEPMAWIWEFIDENGRVTAGRLIRGTHDPRLDTLIMHALPVMRFSPAQVGGKAVGAWVPYPAAIGRYRDVIAWRDRESKPIPDWREGPVFTPYTVKPELLNRDEVSRALVQNYPRALRDQSISGTALIWLLVDSTGVTAKARLKTTSGQPELDEAAIRVARVMKWKPARNRDAPVTAWIALPIVFKSY